MRKGAVWCFSTWAVFLLILHVELVAAQLSVELDIPGYLASEGVDREADVFFSGHRIRVNGEFKSALDVTARMSGRETGVERDVLVRKASRSNIRLILPAEIPSDTYDLFLNVDGVEYETEIEVDGFSEEELAPLEGDGGGAGVVIKDARLPAAVTYLTNLNCGGCYWEHVLVGHPNDPDTLVLAGMGRSTVTKSRDGGLTWQVFSQPDDMRFSSDPSALITSEGRYYLAALTSSPRHPNADSHAWAGVLYQADVGDLDLTGTFFREIPDDLPANSGGVADYPKLGYDPITGTIYMTSNAALFDDGTSGMGLYVSRDDGQRFSETKLLEYWRPCPRGPPESVDTTFSGELRASLFLDPCPEKGTEDLSMFVLRFDEEGNELGLSSPIVPDLSPAYARVSDSSDRRWNVHKGPVIAIDKSDRHPGRTYMVWAEPKALGEGQFGERTRTYGHDWDIFLGYSDDDGESWSEKIQLNEDQTEGDQAFPSIDIDSDGVVHLAWFDKRENPGLPYLDVYYVLDVNRFFLGRQLKLSTRPTASPDGETLS